MRENNNFFTPVTSDKCEVCVKKTGTGCCDTYPFFTEDELGRLMFETDVLKQNHNLTLSRVTDGYYILVPNNDPDINKGYVDLTKPKKCPFLKNNKCVIYDYRPSTCKDFGTSYPCPMFSLSKEELNAKSNEEVKAIYEDNSKLLKPLWVSTALKDKVNANNKLKIVMFTKFLPKIYTYNRKLMKCIRDDLLLYLIVNNINNIIEEQSDNDFFSYKKSYKLVINTNGRISSVLLYVVKAKNENLVSLEKAYNYLERKFILKDSLYINNVLVPKLQGIIKGLNVPELNISAEEYNLYLSYLILEKYKYDFNNKCYKELPVTEDDLFATKKYILRRLTGGKDIKVWEAFDVDVYKKLHDFVEKLYRKVNELRVY